MEFLRALLVILGYWIAASGVLTFLFCYGIARNKARHKRLSGSDEDDE